MKTLTQIKEFAKSQGKELTHEQAKNLKRMLSYDKKVRRNENRVNTRLRKS